VVRPARVLGRDKVMSAGVCVDCLFLRSPSRVPYRTELIPRAPKGVTVVRREKFIRETFIGETNQQLLAPGSFNSVQKPLASSNIAELFFFFKRINTGRSPWLVVACSNIAERDRHPARRGGTAVPDTTTTMPGPCSEKSASPREGRRH
jgi:hypothetical protein